MGPPEHSTNDIDKSKSTSGSYPSPAGHSPNTSHPPTPHVQTLPPIVHHNISAYPAMYGGGHPPTPHTPGTPNTPGAGSNQHNYPQHTSQPGARTPAYAMAGPPQYSSAHGGYATSTGMMPQATQAPHPQPIAPAPLAGRGAPILRPSPQGVMSGPMMAQSQGMPEGDQPTHVVGGQGRRGILPSAPGRPPVGHDGKGPYQFEKTADGKFQCPHCPKTYLHQKHLKRHMLRHTGDRPYRCVLCHDTFSRSDILKRHFQKCSIRRGNPAGVSHLSHPGAHVKKAPPPAAQRTLPNTGMGEDLHHLNGSLGGLQVQGEGMSQPYPMVSVGEGGLPNLAGDQGQLSRSANGGNQDRQGMAGPVMGATAGRGGNFEQSYGGNVGGSMANQQMQGYNMPAGQNGMPMYGSGSNSNQQVDWQSLNFQHSGAQETYANAFPPNIGQTQIAVKEDPNVESGRADGITVTNNACEPLFFLPPSPQNNCITLASKIISHVLPHARSDFTSDSIRAFYTGDNVREFLNKYTHFHLHFPMIHVPTFRVMEAYTGLLAVLCCVGACYSDRVSSSQVRQMADIAHAALKSTSSMCDDITAGRLDNIPVLLSKSDLEELQAMVVSSMLHVWHGTPQQRDLGRNNFTLLAAFMRRSGLLHVYENTSSVDYSPLHQLDFDSHNLMGDDFNWESWVEQEKRVRLVHIIYLADTAMSLYFNMAPQLDAYEMEVPLPCDDGAWDAPTAYDCAAALGLYGPDEAMRRNADGTRHAKQPQMSLALRALLHPSFGMQPGSTNLYGKFILIHAILAWLRKGLAGSFTGNDMGTPPLRDMDWATQATNSGGRLTPVDGVAQQLPREFVAEISNALDKFKSSWDVDMARQFPPTASPKNPRRYGFSRDGIHFYYLAKWLLKKTQRAHLELPPDTRFAQVMHLLKSVKIWVISDGEKRGEELGSVGAIDKDYGTVDSTLDMAQLFAPLSKYVDDPRIPSVKTENDEGSMI